MTGDLNDRHGHSDNAGGVKSVSSRGSDVVDEADISKEIPVRLVSQRSVHRHGILYRGVRTDSQEDVELFVLLDADEGALRTVRRRISLIGRLAHPGCIRVTDTGADGGGKSFLVETTCESLREVRDRSEPSSFDAFWNRVEECADLLAAAHRLGLAHGDISPESIHLGADSRAKIDFLRPWLRQDSLDPDPADDILGLANVLVWMLGIESDDQPERISQLRKQLPEANPSSDEDSDRLLLGDLLASALGHEPSDRPTAAELHHCLRSLAGASPSDATADLTTVASDENLDAVVATIDSGTPPALHRQHSDRPLSSIGAGDLLGRFRIHRKIGQGGMGEVYEAVDLSDGTTVALKALTQNKSGFTDAVRRFRKEARLLGEIQSPYVTSLIEVNEDRGWHYLVMEFVPGTSLFDVLRANGRFDENIALSVIADAARGLCTAHQRGIIHRDIKPSNILLAVVRSESDPDLGIGSGSDASRLDPANEGSKRYRVKVSDFGLARHISQSESLEMTRRGGLIGTPTYMAPEQFSDPTAVSPATDVYALGVTLFEMLAGKPPFHSKDVTKLVHSHSQQPPPDLRSINRNVSDAAWQIVRTAMAKDPQERPADAAQFLNLVERLLHGETTGIAVHPEAPPHNPKRLFEQVFEWQLQASPFELWPYVSNTERINQAVGVPSVVYQTRRDPSGRLHKYGTFRMAGQEIGWEEHPFEWVEGQRLGILREFQRGPFRWFLSIVELEPHVGGGTLLRHTVRIEPQNVLGRLAAALEVTVKGKRNLDRVYHRIDRAITGNAKVSSVVDPFVPPPRMSAAQTKRLQSALEKMAGHGIDPDIVDGIGQLITDAPAQSLARIRPVNLANELSRKPQEIVSACLVAAKEGLLNLRWDVLCPTCRIPSVVVDSLEALESHAHCEACDLAFELDFASSVEMIFQTHPAVREADLRTYCIGGPEHSPHVIFQVRLPPGRRLELAPVLSEGTFALRSPQLPGEYRVQAVPDRGGSYSELVLPTDLQTQPTSQVRVGRNIFMITNDHAEEVIVRLERRIARSDVFTAAEASSLPIFREMFPAESPAHGRLINVARIAILVVDIMDTDEMFAELDDANAYAAVHQFHEAFLKAAGRTGGARFKLLETEALFVFQNPADCVRCAFDTAIAIDQAVRQGNVAYHLDYRCCIHTGTAIATGSDSQLDYFGRCIHEARQLLHQATPGELLITEKAVSDPGVANELLHRSPAATVRDIEATGQCGNRCHSMQIGH